MKYGKPAIGRPAIKDKASKKVKESAAKMIKKKMASISRGVHARLTANQARLSKSYYHWISVLKMFLDPKISSNVMALVVPRVMHITKAYPHMGEFHWFALMFIFNTPFASVKEVNAAIAKQFPGRKFSPQICGSLYKYGLLERKTSNHFNNFRYFYIISLEGKQLVNFVCDKTLSKQIINYLKHKHDHLKWHTTVAKREKLLREWDWYDVPDIKEASFKFDSIPKKRFLASERGQKWIAEKKLAGQWTERSTPPDQL